jgi:hypothetical protein
MGVGVNFFGAGILVSAGCFDPTPAEPVTCAAGFFGAASMTAGAGVLGRFGYQTVKDELIPGVKQAITCNP